MKVKKGIASKVSFDMTPHNLPGMVLRSGQLRLIAPSDKGASSTPIRKKRRPLAASEKATG